MMGSGFRAALAVMSSRVKQAILGGGAGSRLARTPGVIGAAPVPIHEPFQGPKTSSPLRPRRRVLGGALHLCGRCYVGEITGDVEIQQFELKTRLLALGTYVPTVSTAEQIMNDARLDLKSLPLLSKLDVSECIDSYVSVLRKVEASDCYYQFLISLVLGDYIELSNNPEILVGLLRSRNVFSDLDPSVLERTVEEYIGLCNIYCPSSSEDWKNEVLEKLENDRCDEMARVYKKGLDQSLFANYTGDLFSLIDEDEREICLGTTNFDQGSTWTVKLRLVWSIFVRARREVQTVMKHT